MPLTPANIVDYVHGRRLIGPDSVVAGEFNVTDVSRRHHNREVASDSGHFFLKQGTGEAKGAAVGREAAVYQLLSNRSAAGEFVRYLPRLVDYDQERHVLVVEWVDGARNLREYHTRRGQFPRQIARTMGEALGTLHGRALASGVEDGAGWKAGSPPPWVLSIHRPNMSLFQEASGASLELIQMVQEFPRLGELLDQLQAEWSPSAFIHHDLKWDNCLLRAASVDTGGSRLKIVDWELAGAGDPCWDVGSVFNDYLSFWLHSVPATGQMALADLLDLARYPLEKMHPALRAFWDSYALQMQLDAEMEGLWRTRAVRYAAARLIQTAFEQMQGSTQLTGNVVCSVQLSLNVLQRPEEAAVRLLGLPPSGG